MMLSFLEQMETTIKKTANQNEHEEPNQLRTSQSNPPSMHHFPKYQRLLIKILGNLKKLKVEPKG